MNQAWAEFGRLLGIRREDVALLIERLNLLDHCSLLPPHLCGVTPILERLLDAGEPNSGSQDTPAIASVTESARSVSGTDIATVGYSPNLISHRPTTRTCEPNPCISPSELHTRPHFLDGYDRPIATTSIDLPPTCRPPSRGPSRSIAPPGETLSLGGCSLPCLDTSTELLTPTRGITPPSPYATPAQVHESHFLDRHHFPYPTSTGYSPSPLYTVPLDSPPPGRSSATGSNLTPPSPFSSGPPPPGIPLPSLGPDHGLSSHPQPELPSHNQISLPSRHPSCPEPELDQTRQESSRDAAGDAESVTPPHDADHCNSAAVPPTKRKVKRRSYRSSPCDPSSSRVDAILAELAEAHWDSSIHDVQGWVRTIGQLLQDEAGRFQDQSLCSILSRYSRLQTRGIRADFLWMIDLIQLFAKCRNMRKRKGGGVLSLSKIHRSELGSMPEKICLSTFTERHTMGSKFAALAGGGSVYLLILIAGLGLRVNIGSTPGNIPWALASALRSPTTPHHRTLVQNSIAPTIARMKAALPLTMDAFSTHHELHHICTFHTWSQSDEFYDAIQSHPLLERDMSIWQVEHPAVVDRQPAREETPQLFLKFTKHAVI